MSKFGLRIVASLVLMVLFSLAIVVPASVVNASGGTLTLTSPNGGEILAAGSVKTITWTYSGFTGDVQIDLYKGGAFKQTILSSRPASYRSYNWTIPFNQEPSTNTQPDFSGDYTADYRVLVTSISDPGANDQSDNPFTIRTPQLALTSPNGGESWTAGTIHPITWTSTANTGYIKIELYRNGNPYKIITNSSSAGYSGAGSYNWNIPANTALDSTYKIRITYNSLPFTGVPTIFDESNANFSIAAGLYVTSPNTGSEVWYSGSTYTITWNYADITGRVKIELLKAGLRKGTLASSVSIGSGGSGSFSWKIPVNTPTGSDYSIRVTSTSRAGVTNTSNANFTIAGPSLTLISPNGSETWAAGSSQLITWNFTGLGGFLKIELYKNGKFNQRIAANSDAPINVGASTETPPYYQGSYKWNLPLSLASGSDYRIKITSVSNPKVFDSSNNNFNITGTGLTVTAPNGGQTFGVGSQQTIYWSYTGNLTGQVKIELVKTAGLAKWISNAPIGTAGGGSFSWVINSDQDTTGTYTIRVTSLSNPTLYDSSDNTFTFTAAGIDLQAPDGGETWIINSPDDIHNYNITWTNAGTLITGNLKIELLRYNVSNVLISTTFIDTAAASALAYNWTISGVTADTRYKIKITAVYNANVTDISAAYFTISEPAP